MPCCALKSCESRYAKWAGPDFSLFTFPVNTETRNKWTRFVQIERKNDSWFPSATARLCSLHFKKEDHIRGKSGRLLLKRGALPCLCDGEMQQQMSQPEPIGGHQALSQQMVLCPVRFVYETQVLVQPGEQIQPNQTFFINPQNPPPWMQNRQPPNPVVYVQQLQNNIVPSVQQQMDQNQLYLQQNYANFQLQQHMLAQNHQEIRPTMQLANIVPNMVQNVQQNMSNDRNVQTANNGQMQANNQNMIQNQMNIVNTRQVTNQPMNQTVEVQRPVFMNMRPQIAHQVNIARPVMSINQIQNMQQLANVQNVQIQHTNLGQTIFQSVGQRPPSVQNVNTVRPQTPANTIVNIQPVAKVREIAPSDVKQTMNTAVGPAVPVRNFSQNYNCRQIQPKRRYVQNTAANTTINKVQSQHVPVQAIPTGYNADKSNTHQTATNVATNTNYLNNPNTNRKRKSESPDEVQKKMAIQTAIKPNYNPQQSMVVTKLCNEIGTNTSPVHKPYATTNNVAIQINPNTPVMLVENIQLLNENILKNTEQNIAASPVQNEKDKLIRNTVYTQARGRVLQDKISESIKPQVENHTALNIASFEVQTDATVINEVNNVKAAIQTEIQTEKAAVVVEPEIFNMQLEQETNSEINSKIETQTLEQAINSPDVTITIRVMPGETNVKEDVSKNEDAKPEVEKKVETNKEKDFILTHVVDGYVIQESNFAFPIRKPLKEKTLFMNSKAEDSESTDALKECMREEMKSNAVDIPLLPFHYLLLNCDKKEEEEKTKEEKAKEENAKEEKTKEEKTTEEKTNEDKTKGENTKEEKTKEEDDSMKNNPFETLQQTTVKTWTVEDLSQHLLKYDWKDTVSVFQDHEIDGESLFLVSKTQLMNIGVAEEHTDVICEFVRS